MLDFALHHDAPVSIRYPKASVFEIEGHRDPVELGKAEVLSTGDDGAIVCCGTMLSECIQAAELLGKSGLDVGVINARSPLHIEFPVHGSPSQLWRIRRN
jgi:1-deoxy-D-xylulose-5-phosphate synthase